MDVIFNNAGVMPVSPMNALKTDEWDRIIDVNIKGVLNGIAAVLADHGGARQRPHHQHGVHGRACGGRAVWRVLRQQVRGARHHGRVAAGDEPDSRDR